jgi:EAL domain-containing protein (putative c-di-GMP-specific phosphodiesterase class I)
VRRGVAEPSFRAELEQLAARAHDSGVLVGVEGIDTRAEHDAAWELSIDHATGEFYGSAVAAESVG